MQIVLMGAGVTPVKVFDASQHKGKKYGLMVQVVDAINVWIATNQTELEQLSPIDSNPMGGIELQGALASATFIQFADKLYAISSAQGRINVFPYVREL